MKKNILLSIVLLVTMTILDVDQLFASNVCGDCRLSMLPMNIELPTINEMKSFYAKIGLDKASQKKMENNFINLVNRMQNRTFNSNGFVYITSLFKVLSMLEIKEIKHDALMFLGKQFRNKLSDDQWMLLMEIIKKMDRIQLYRNEENELTVILRTQNAKPIRFTSGEIPVGGQGGRDLLDKYFDFFELKDATSLKYSNLEIANESQTTKEVRNKGLSKLDIQSFTLPSSIAIQGMKVVGRFPIIGNLEVTPKILYTDIDDNTSPAKIRLSFKKGFINPYYTFDLE